ncbi:hypothetical protein EPA93_00695 [Ktedonosporobacter rubrisoli]|uniref:Zinc finger CGNR domain-containing protein n=1 Tax=Ktedonosporobacter rubrisoli TaxID=2509675 RepID=A0A4P6JHS7_KTERU|nr:ABATE domain-containing protein [Ktedonosporobacter rubrisoli]QBD74588.1 hypothetical protein EPA93_00695 [Ktedonosporobacter rubrisoli]
MLKTRRNPYEKGQELAPQQVLLGGALCLDFVNTVEPRAGSPRRDYLGCYTDLISWSVHAGALSAPRAELLLKKACEYPEEADRMFERAIELREAAYRMFSALVSNESVVPSDLETINALMGRLRIAQSVQGFAWHWAATIDDLAWPLWPVVHSVGEVLTTEKLQRVKACPHTDGCGWLFLDTSKNRSRRYCSMKGCGNRARASRYYRRTRIQQMSLADG